MLSRAAIGLALVLTLLGPAAFADEPTTETKLYFGLSSEDGAGVSEQQWARFLDDTVTVRFPGGLTVVDAIGQWRNEKGDLVSEKTKLLIVVRPATPENDRAVAEIKAEYVKRFHQSGVFQTETPTRIVD